MQGTNLACSSHGHNWRQNMVTIAEGYKTAFMPNNDSNICTHIIRRTLVFIAAPISMMLINCGVWCDHAGIFWPRVSFRVFSPFPLWCAQLPFRRHEIIPYLRQSSNWNWCGAWLSTGWPSVGLSVGITWWQGTDIV